MLILFQIIFIFVSVHFHKCIYDTQTIFNIEHEELTSIKNQQGFILMDEFENIFSYKKIDVNLIIIEINLIYNNDVSNSENNTKVDLKPMYNNFKDYKGGYFAKTNWINILNKNSNLDRNQLKQIKIEDKEL